MSLINTRLNSFRAASTIDKWETRASRYGAFDLFRRDSENPNGIISEDLKSKAIAAIGSTLEIPVIDYDSGVSVTNVTQPVTITGSPSTSQLYTVTFTQYYWGFLIHPAAHMNNEISVQREFNVQMRKHILKFLDLIDTACVSALDTAKTQVLTDDLGGRYSLIANEVVAPLAEQDAVVGDVNPLMGGNDFYGPFNVVANPSMESLVRNRLLEKGQFQDSNKTYQYSDKTWTFTNRLANAALRKATGFFVQDGSVGLVQQFGADNVMRNSTNKHQWDIETLPIAGIPIGTYGYEDAVDGSSLHGAASAHLTATKVEAYGFHTAMAFVVPYNSAAGTIPSAIMRVGVATT